MVELGIIFIRKTHIGKTAAGEAYYTYRLLRARREGNRRGRQETLLNLIQD